MLSIFFLLCSQISEQHLPSLMATTHTIVHKSAKTDIQTMQLKVALTAITYTMHRWSQAQMVNMTMMTCHHRIHQRISQNVCLVYGIETWAQL